MLNWHYRSLFRGQVRNFAIRRPSYFGVSQPRTSPNILEACREELESVLEGWVLVSVADHSPIPDIDGNHLEVRAVA
jgi:hypothetical protein